MRVNAFVIFGILSKILFIESIALISCIIIALIFNEDTLPFVYSGFIVLACGIIFKFISRKEQAGKIKIREAYLTVTSSWLIVSLLGSLPYLLSNTIPSVNNAIFESVSGFSTTGASILTDVEILPKSILFWRSLTHWIGGIGIIVLVIVIIPSINIGGQSLFSLESSFQEKIHPRIKSVGFRLLYIYLGLTILEIILLMAGNMNWFDSICHSFGTVATGGFSTKNTSIGGYSPYIQYVVTLFMLLAGTNFLIHYYIIKRNFNKVKENDEWKFYLLVVLSATLIISFFLVRDMGLPYEKAFRDSLFQVVSIVTCTGFATTDYLLWPDIAWIMIFFLMFTGGSIGSTSGGIKMLRHLVLFKNIRRTFQLLIQPNAYLNIKVNGKILPDIKNTSILSFITIYLIIFVIGSMILIASGLDFESSIGAVITCMGGIGPGIGTVGPAANFNHIPEVAKITLSVLMIVGRLEIYTVLAIFTISFWKK